MFHNSEPENAVSFTDETHRINKEKTSRRIWTHAQISNRDSVLWFHELRTLYPEIEGELKSFNIVKDFDKMQRNLKFRVASGVRKARIHIVDTLAYEAREKQIFREIYKCDNYEKFIQNLPDKNQAKKIILMMEEGIAERIIFDSPAQRLERKIQATRYLGYGYYTSQANERHRKRLSTDLEPFKKGSKKIYDTASKYVSKSSSIFSDALDFTERGFCGGEYETRQQVGDILNVSHAFDEGDNQSIQWLEEQREYFIEGVVYNAFGNNAKLYGNVDSKLSFRVQAADIAAGIAQKKYDENGLESVFECFDYITFNGERINEINIRERLYYWEKVEEKENKIQNLIVGLKNVF